MQVSRPIGFVLAISYIAFCVGITLWPKIHIAQSMSLPIISTITVDEVSMDEIIEDTLEKRRLRNEDVDETDLESLSQINILVLGLDARKANQNPHCDAIHMFSLDLDQWNMTVTSVPRGTYAYIPPGNYPATEYYLANACSFAGLPYGIEQIEKVIGIKADYVVTVGFSQVMGIVRQLNLPPVESLQWLRNRHTYAIGDPQRSHNQAVFMKDLIINQIDNFEGRLSIPLERLLYSFLNTDLSFETAHALLKGFQKAELSENPWKITLQMRPYYQTADYHFDPENAEEQIQKIADFLAPRLSRDDFSKRTTEDVQNELIAYLERRLASIEPIDDLLKKQIWLQVNDPIHRERLQFEILKRQIETLGDEEAIIELVSAYIIEKETLEETEFAEMGKALLEEYVVQTPQPIIRL